jgi:hypothetical protein
MKPSRRAVPSKIVSLADTETTRRLIALGDQPPGVLVLTTF